MIEHRKIFEGLIRPVFSGPACFTFDVKILFDNSDHDGQIVISLDTLPHRIPCPEGYQVLCFVFREGGGTPNVP